MSIGFYALLAAVKRVTKSEDTVLKNFPLYCPKCKQESLIEVENLNIVVIKEPDA